MNHEARPALAFILQQDQQVREECYSLPFAQQRIYFLARQRTPQWCATFMRHGVPPSHSVPVRLCDTFDCINGAHYKWGTQGEVNRKRSMPDQSGEGNPNSKLTELEVAQLRCVNWGTGVYKLQAASAAGISGRTLALVLNKRIWRDVAPYQSSVPPGPKRKKHRDAF